MELFQHLIHWVYISTLVGDTLSSIRSESQKGDFAMKIVFQINGEHILFKGWVEFIIPSAHYQRYETPTLLTWDRLFVAPPHEIQDRR